VGKPASLGQERLYFTKRFGMALKIKLIYKKSTNAILFVFLLFATSCLPEMERPGHDHAHGGHDGHSGHDHESHDGHDNHAHGHTDGELRLTEAQVKTTGLELGKFSEMKINDYVAATGKLGLPPNSVVSVNAKMEGFLRGAGKFVEGAYVKKGDLVAYLENPEFILKQKEYMELQAEMDFLQKEVRRHQELISEKAGVQKLLDEAKSKVAIKNAQIKGLEKYLDYLGINPRDSYESIKEKVGIYTPISGYVSKVGLHNGMHVSPRDELLEIVDEVHLHLELDVYERDLAKVKEGQPISYTLSAYGGKEYRGEVHVIGKELDLDKKTVHVHGHTVGKKPPYAKGLFLEAKIWLNDQSVQALPEEAIMKDGDDFVIYASKGMHDGDMHFSPKRVLPKGSERGFTAVELLDPLAEGEGVVVKGANFVYSLSKVGELRHEH
jgi:cobalt-zinc-cadmium efflux system membrane fusion protein